MRARLQGAGTGRAVPVTGWYAARRLTADDRSTRARGDIVTLHCTNRMRLSVSTTGVRAIWLVILSVE